MRLHPIIISVSILMMLSMTSCGKTETRPDYYEEVVAAANHDVRQVASAPAASMERERAVLAIRVKENALRRAGHAGAADLYYSTANSLLTDSLHIITAR